MHYYVILDHYRQGDEYDNETIIVWSNDINLIHLYIRQFDEEDISDFGIYEYDVKDIDDLARAISNQFYKNETCDRLRVDLNAYKLIFKLLKNKRDHIVLTQFEVDNITLGIEDLEAYCDDYRRNLISMLTFIRFLSKDIQKDIRKALQIFVWINSMMMNAMSSNNVKEVYSLTSLVDPFAIYKYYTTNTN